MTPEQQEKYYAKVLEEEREVVRQRVKQIKQNELREKAKEQVRAEIKKGEIPPKPPQAWGEYFQENASYAFNKVHNFAVVYITAENATYGVGALAVGGMAVTKKGAAAAAAIKTGVVAAVVANPVVAVGGAMLIGFGAYKYKHRNDPVPVMATVPANTPRPHAM
jgi:hypothetical protein